MLIHETKGIAVLLLINMCINYGIFIGIAVLVLKAQIYEYNTLI